MWMIIISAVVIVGLVHWLLNGSFNYWKKRGVPFPPPKPWVGNIGESLIMKKHLGQIYADIYKEFKNYLYVGVYRMQTPALLIRDAELLKSILISDFASFHDSDILNFEEIDPLFGKNPFVLKGHKWKVMRSHISTGITSRKIKNMFPLMNNVGKNMVNYIKTEPNAEDSNGLDAKEFATKYTTDVVSSCAFGLEGNSFTDPNSEFQVMGQKLFSRDFLTNLKFFIIFIVPKLSTFLKLKIIPDEVSNWFIGILSKTIKYREANNIVRNDYLDIMISLKTKNLEYEFTDMDVIGQAMTFYGDGLETSSILLSFTLYELACNPDIQKKLQEEVDKILAKNQGEITYGGIQEMLYLNKITSESLRKYPPTTVLSKLCTKDYTLPPANKNGTGKNVLIKNGTSVVVSIYGVHHDPQYYPDPEKFDPERFTEEAKNSRPKCSFIPFGEGPRICMGYRFALTQVKAAIVAIVKEFDIKVNPKTTPTFEFDPKFPLLGKKGGIFLNFYPRK